MISMTAGFVLSLFPHWLCGEMEGCSITLTKSAFHSKSPVLSIPFLALQQHLDRSRIKTNDCVLEKMYFVSTGFVALDEQPENGEVVLTILLDRGNTYHENR